MELVATKTGVSVHPLDDPAAWATPAYQAPLGEDEIAAFQRDVDSIVGVTRDNKSIVKLIWNGDKRYWKKICLDWTPSGEPREFIRRPIVLYRSVKTPQSRKLIRDEFPPRWLLVTRIEREQYEPTWDRDSKIYFPERGAFLQVRPRTPPDEMYVWFMTIAKHNPFCCRLAAEADRICYGDYAHPNVGIEELRKIRKGMEEANLPDSTPFDSPDRLSRKLRDRGVHDYEEQALSHYNDQASQFIDAVPFKELKRRLNDEKQRNLERLAAEIKGRQIQ